MCLGLWGFDSLTRHQMATISNFTTYGYVYDRFLREAVVLPADQKDDEYDRERKERYAKEDRRHALFMNSVGSLFLTSFVVLVYKLLST